MDNLTYTAIGNFYKSSRSMMVNLKMDKEITPGLYKFTKYDMSKTVIKNKKINVIFCHFTYTGDNGTELLNSSYEQPLMIDIDRDCSPFPNQNAERFDFDLNESLLVIFHDNQPNSGDLDIIYNYLELFYMEATKGNYSFKLDSPTDKIKDLIGGRPRMLGVSIIRQ